LFTLSVSGNTAEFEMTMVCTTEEKARKIRDEAESEWKKRKDQMTDKEKASVKTFKVGGSGKEVTVKVSGDIEEKSSGGGKGGGVFGPGGLF